MQAVYAVQKNYASGPKKPSLPILKFSMDQYMDFQISRSTPKNAVEDQIFAFGLTAKLLPKA
jgi:hypothetical protein